MGMLDRRLSQGSEAVEAQQCSGCSTMDGRGDRDASRLAPSSPLRPPLKVDMQKSQPKFTAAARHI